MSIVTIVAWYFVDNIASFHWKNSKQAKFRVKEHRKNITQHHQPSLIYQHIVQEHDDMNWNNVSILKKTPKYFPRKFLEFLVQISWTMTLIKLENYFHIRYRFTIHFLLTLFLYKNVITYSNNLSFVSNIQPSLTTYSKSFLLKSRRLFSLWID